MRIRELMTRGTGLLPAVAFIAAALACALLPLGAYFGDPVYAREMRTPGFIWGGVEALGLFAVFALTANLKIRRAWRLITLSLGTFAYLRLHDVELPFLFAVFWLEGILATGAWLSRRPPRLPGAALFSVRFVLGICLWLCGALVLSLLHLATAGGLLAYTVLLFTAAILGLRRKPFVATAGKFLTHADAVIAVCSLYILTCVLVLFARSPTVKEFDSIWYGLRGPWVLAPHGSLFDHLNLITYLYYYPKLFELLVLPAETITDFTYTYAVNIVAYLACGIAALATLRYSGMKLRHAMLAAALILSMPAMTSMAMTAKPDIMLACFLLIGSLFFVIGISRGQLVWLLGTLGAVLLGLSTKLSAIPFGGLLALAAVTVLCLEFTFHGQQIRPAQPAVRRLTLSILVLSSVAFIAFSFRTYLLTGFPFVGNESLVALFKALGFSSIYPANPYNALGIDAQSEHARIFFDYLFRPTALQNVSWVWPGNFAALLIVCGCLYAVAQKLKPPWCKAVIPLLPVTAAGLLLAVSYGQIPGGDGNYYIFPVALATLIGLGLIWQSGRHARTAALMTLPVFIAANSFIGFLSSPGAQHPGTEAFSLNFMRSPLEHTHTPETVVTAGGLGPVLKFIRENMDGDCRAIGTGGWDELLLLPCTIQTPEGIMQSRDIPKSSQALVEYLNFAKINLLISSKFPADTEFSHTVAFVRGLGLPVIETPTYFAIDLRPVAGKIPPPPERTVDFECRTFLFSLTPDQVVTSPASPASPGQAFYRDAPGRYSYYTDVPAELTSPDVMVRYSLPSPRCPHRPQLKLAYGILDAAVGLRPEDTLGNSAPLQYSMRILASDGRELAAGTWTISPGDDRVVQVKFPNAENSYPAFVELRCDHAAPAGKTAPQLLIGQLLVRWYGDTPRPHPLMPYCSFHACQQPRRWSRPFNGNIPSVPQR